MKLPENLLRSIEAHWDSSIIISIFKGEHIHPDYAMKAIRAVWRVRSRLDMIQQGKNRFVCKFEKLVERERICDDQPWKIMGKILLIQPFSSEMDPSVVEFNTIPVWTSFEGLKLEHLHHTVIEMIAAAAGTVKDVNPKNGLPRGSEGFKARIELNVHEPILQGVPVNSVRWGRTWVNFLYKDIANCYCLKCFRFGHLIEDCPYEQNLVHVLDDVQLLDDVMGQPDMAQVNKYDEADQKDVNPIKDQRVKDHVMIHLEMDTNEGDSHVGPQLSVENNHNEVSKASGSFVNKQHQAQVVDQPLHHIIGQPKQSLTKAHIIKQKGIIDSDMISKIPNCTQPSQLVVNRQHGRGGLPLIGAQQRYKRHPRLLSKEIGNSSFQGYGNAHKKRKASESFQTHTQIIPYEANLPLSISSLPRYESPKPFNNGAIQLAWKIVTNPTSINFLLEKGFINNNLEGGIHIQPLDSMSRENDEFQTFEDQVELLLNNANLTENCLSEKLLELLVPGRGGDTTDSLEAIMNHSRISESLGANNSLLHSVSSGIHSQ
ncbi:hypothetical protein FRX31_028003, partial [Thalictrum thalictroides]